MDTAAGLWQKVRVKFPAISDGPPAQPAVDFAGQNRSGNLAWLDLVRGVAALMVMMSHLRGFFFVKWSDLEPASQTSVNFLLFFITRLGREAVVVFFVLSGYLVGGNALSKYMKGGFVIRDYWAHRLARLYTVLIPALALTALLDLGRFYVLGNTDVALNLGWRVLLGNLFFLQNVTTPTFGSDSPLWSLSYEFWFYLVWGCLLCSLNLRIPRFWRMASGLIIIFSLGVMWPDILAYLPMWCLGVVIKIYPIRIKPGLGWVVMLFCLACLVISNRFLNVWGDYLLAASIGLVIMWLVNRDMKFKWLKAVAHFTANISYTTYSMHFPVVAFVLAWLLPHRLKAASFQNWLIYLSLLLAIYFICWLLYLCFERHTGKVRKWLEAKL
jgi:peptidoglycan/LPS O-acetylase OafA/YrhL